MGTRHTARRYQMLVRRARDERLFRIPPPLYGGPTPTEDVLQASQHLENR